MKPISTKQQQIREEIAALEHDQWITWADSIMKSEKVSPERNKRWLSLFVPYAELSEEMKDHDRKWADKIMAIFAREQEELVKENKQLDMYLNQALEERDSAEEWADKFAYTISAKLGIDVGEHSNMNSPWVNAYEALDDLTTQLPEEKEA